jgi:hypothetical protein
MAAANFLRGMRAGSPLRSGSVVLVGEDGKEAGDVPGCLPSILTARPCPAQDCPTWYGLLTRLSRAAGDDFTEDLTAGFEPYRAPGLQIRHSTDNPGPYVICIFGVPILGITGHSSSIRARPPP